MVPHMKTSCTALQMAATGYQTGGLHTGGAAPAGGPHTGALHTGGATNVSQTRACLRYIFQVMSADAAGRFVSTLRTGPCRQKMKSWPSCGQAALHIMQVPWPNVRRTNGHHINSFISAPAADSILSRAATGRRDARGVPGACVADAGGAPLRRRCEQDLHPELRAPRPRPDRLPREPPPSFPLLS